MFLCRSSRRYFEIASAILVILSAELVSGLHAAQEDVRRAEEISFFETRIRPVLENSCKSCHGPKVAESDLRLDSLAALKQGGAVYGPAVVPGKPEESPLLLAITYQDPDLKMPPKPGPLNDEVVSDFRQWILRGAIWPESDATGQTVKRFDLVERKSLIPWLWKTPVRPEIPVVHASDWSVNEVDRFVLHKLEEKGLKPAPETDDLAWLRRVALILTGLPPTLKEISDYQSDLSPNRREKMIDRYLASSAYGERQARHWMDLVRYAESRGHEGDYTIANAWRYRDYLIQAFNDDIPYDQFVREQLAGDLLDQPRFDQKTGANLSVLGTGWPFLGEEVHSPVDIRQDETDRLDNKIDVLGKTFLGLTIACARCHDHKFDAISQKDYYALAGFFQGSTYRQVPFATMSADQEVGRQLDQLRHDRNEEVGKLVAESKLGQVQELCKKLIDQNESPDAPWVKTLRKEAHDQKEHPLNLWFALSATSDSEKRKELAHQFLSNRTAQADQNQVVQTILNFIDSATGWSVDGRAFGGIPVKPGSMLPPKAADSSTFDIQTRAAAVVDRHFASPRNDPQSEGEAGSLGGWLRGSGTGRTHKFTLRTGHVQYQIKGKIRVFACVASHYMLTGPLHGVLSREIEVKSDQPGWVYQNLTEYVGQRVVIEVSPSPGQEAALFQIVETQTAQAPAAEPTSESFAVELAKAIEAEPTQETLNRWIFQRLNSTLMAFARRNPVLEEEARWMALVGRYPQMIPGLSERVQPVLASWYKQEQAIASSIKPQSPTAPALVDLNPIDENVLLRGGWRRPGQLAVRNLPEAFDQELSLSRSGSGRLELAMSLTRPDQPLLARVWVNRLWQQVFGRGIVPTPDNFGVLGQRPTHPELLDWLAVSFTTNDGWSTKQAFKRLLLSRTFAMTSHATDQNAEMVDPANELYHRYNLIRTEAELIRDSILAVSGRLDQTLYGPGIPVHLTEFIVGRGRPGVSGPLDGAGRRSIYTAVRRNFLPTFLVAFDLPTPFSTVGRRNMTNVPAQALALANDPFVLEQARFWADRELKAFPDSSDEQRLNRMFQTAMTRQAKADEIATMKQALSLFTQDRAGSDKAKTEALADLAHLIFSLNEFRYVP